MNFQPDYRHIVNAAYNREAVRLPLYEHIVSADVSFSGTTVMT